MTESLTLVNVDTNSISLIPQNTNAVSVLVAPQKVTTVLTVGTPGPPGAAATSGGITGAIQIKNGSNFGSITGFTIIGNTLNAVNLLASGTVLGSNLSGTNTGDETTSSIKTKLGTASNSTHGYLTSTDWTTFNNKQNAITLGSTSQYLRGDLSLATFPTTLSAFTNDLGNYGGFLTASSTITNAMLANSAITLGSTAVSLGSTATTLSGLTSISATTFTGALSGNASTATKLATARTINGVSFDGSGNINITVDASTLTGTIQAAQFPALSGDITTTAGSLSTTISSSAVTLAKMANLAANSIIGNNTGSAATPIALTTSQVKTLLAIKNTDVTGLRGTAVIDFGSTRKNDTTVVISGLTSILNTQLVTAQILAIATATHSIDEHRLVPVTLICGAITTGVGFTIYAYSDWQLTGTFNIQWFTL